MSKQEIYLNNTDYNYIMDFERLGVTYFDIPKTGSTSVKQFLLAAENNEDVNPYMPIGHPEWKAKYPNSWVPDYSTYSLRELKVVIVRDPVKRLRSAYTGIFRGWMKRDEEFEPFMERELQTLCDTGPLNFMANHFKPQHWFVPDDLLDLPGLVALDISQLASFPDIMRERVSVDIPQAVPHSNKSKLKEAVTWSYEMLEDWYKHHRPDELEFYNAVQNAKVAAPT